jgi:Na+/H+-dicarboxylate symporter
MAESPARDDARAILLGLLLALVLGVTLRQAPASPALNAIVATAGFVGQVFMRLLQMIIVPLVLSSVCLGILSLDPARLGRLGRQAVVWFLGTTTLAAVVGLAAVLLVQPGLGIRSPGCEGPQDCAPRFACEAGRCVPTVEPPPLGDILLGMIPKNPFGALAATFELPGVIFFAILLSLAILQTGERAQPLRAGLEALGAVMERITAWVMRLAPVGIFGLVFVVILQTGADVLWSVFRYALTVAGAIGIHALIVLPLLVAVLGRMSPWRLLRATSPAWIMAFSTSSSSATLPVTLRTTAAVPGLRPDVVRFSVPLGATVNMNGTALYEAVAALFIAQAFGIELSFGQQVLVVLTSLMAAVGAAGIPSAGLVTLLIVLGAVGLPPEGIALLLPVDRLLDMLRTSCNVWGDICGAAVLSRWDRRAEVSGPSPG